MAYESRYKYLVTKKLLGLFIFNFLESNKDTLLTILTSLFV